MKRFGLTGNMGCGKSTVAALLSKYPDVLTLDCDCIAKDVISSYKNRLSICDALGKNIFRGGETDFQAIARIIFEKPEIRLKFESLIHPLVWSVVEEKLAVAGNSTICIVESAILFETNSSASFAATIVACCNSSEQLRRLQEDRQMGLAQIQARLDQQLLSTEKERRAQFVIQTDCSLDELSVRVGRLYQQLRQHPGVSS